MVNIGVLGLQGDVAKHLEILSSLSVDVTVVKNKSDLASVSGLIIPGGESTTLSLLLDAQGLFVDLMGLLAGKDFPVFGTCAGMVLLANSLLDAKSGQKTLGAIDIVVRRNAFGAQISSFEEDLMIDAIGADPIHAVFIRAPYVVSVGNKVEVLGSVEQDGVKHPVICREGKIMVTSFHPELVRDSRLHELWLRECVG